MMQKERSCSNRTFMELKFDADNLTADTLARSNRTFMELKFGSLGESASYAGSNRTFMELK